MDSRHRGHHVKDLRLGQGGSGKSNWRTCCFLEVMGSHWGELSRVSFYKDHLECIHMTDFRGKMGGWVAG